MKTKAAIAWKAASPLTIEEVDLQGPQAGLPGLSGERPLSLFLSLKSPQFFDITSLCREMMHVWQKCSIL